MQKEKVKRYEKLSFLGEGQVSSKRLIITFESKFEPSLPSLPLFTKLETKRPV
jgi:hypothetical protein